ncbi:unnamed protein product [Nippostrongylus brasiliensis]|uniref:Tropomyosin n=1 Tax=Nippostrongylus brasiliensis TaxID=27835 RepID=A0A158R239_NIPBR|nr:unnamed protein product [Nippostrongylus brasiliensis]
MDAIKKKMQAMKIEKDNALDRADAAEEKVRQITEKLERVEEELRDTQKKMMQTENDLDKAQEDLSNATSQLEDKDKKVQEVCSTVRSESFAIRPTQCHKSVFALHTLARSVSLAAPPQSQTVTKERVRGGEPMRRFDDLLPSYEARNQTISQASLEKVDCLSS